MASIRQKGDSRFWYACITGPDKKQKQFSTGLTDRLEALGVAVATEQALKRHVADPHQLRKALERIAGDYVPPDDTDPAGWLERWAKGRKGEISKATHAAYTNAMGEAAGWMRGQGIGAFAALTPARVVDLRNHWAQNNAARTVVVKIKILRGALADARREKLVTENPAEDVAALRSAETRRREFRPEELDRLLPKLSGEWRGLFHLGLYTGQRLNDLAVLTWRAVDMKARSIAFTAAKTGRVVALPLAEAAREALLALPGRAAADAPIFPKIAGIAPGSRSNAFRKILWRAGLARHPHAARTNGSTGGPKETAELCFHSLRHTATSMLKAAGVSDAIARAIIGHESAAVSRVYTHLDMATMREALDKMKIAKPKKRA